MNSIPKAGASVFVLAVVTTFAHSDALQKDTYQHLFTELDTGSTIKHVGNAYSSIIYAILGIWLSRVTTKQYELSRQSDVVVLLWLSVVSFRFHATELLWIETQDLWCVIYLCTSCISRYIERDDKAMVFTWVAMGPLLLDAVIQRVGSAVVLENYIGIIGALIYILLWFSWKSKLQFGLLLVAFVAKLADMAAASNSMYTRWPINGTSAFHILTAAALYVHYKTEVLHHPLPRPVYVLSSSDAEDDAYH